MNLALLAIVALVGTARAQDAVIAIRSETSSIDPHFALVGANQTIVRHVFDTLLDADADMRPTAGLAESWSLVEPTLWEFRLRAGLVFHDGSPLTTADVRYSLERMPNVPNSPAPFVRMAGTTREIIVVDERVIRIRTHAPDPAVPLYAMSAYIIPARLGPTVTTQDFNAGRAAIGSGPYRFVEWVPGERIVLARNDRWHGPRPAMARVVFRPIANDGARLAALLAGDVQMIDAVPPNDIARLRANANVTVWSSGSSRMIYLAMEQQDDAPRGLTDANDVGLTRNPFRDARVRRAINLAINRAAIVDRVLLGAGEAAGQMVPRGMIGHDPTIAPPPFDLDQARRLMAEAGWGQGFRVPLATPNNRYVEDARTAQTVAQMLARIAITVRVDTMAAPIFFTRSANRELPFFLIGFGTTTGDAFVGLSQVLHSFDRERRMGALNRTRYSNPVVDRLLQESQAQTASGPREELLRRATRIAFVEDSAIVPLHFLQNVWATRRGLHYEVAADEGINAWMLRPAP